MRLFCCPMGTPAPDAVKGLVDHFDQNRDAYLSGSYNESQLRHEFLGPFFEALGWDVYNHQGSAMPYRDVIFEDSLKVGGASKAPDYCFCIGGRGTESSVSFDPAWAPV
jgi:hypothetical protein